ncbi:MAG: S-layer homology domain-containing protein [Peptococcaceae bacterium]|nr:S-layer homology domain-containing protein [Peptococcaceae bacterium]
MAGRWRRGCAWVLCIAMLCMMLPAAGWADEGDVAYYLDTQGCRKNIPENAIPLTADTVAWTGQDGEAWYVANGTVSLPQRVEVQGDVYLVLCDGATLNIDQGIHVTGSNSLTIYGQEHGTGKLIAKKVMEENAAIGGNYKEPGGVIKINGGTIDVVGGWYGSGIGGGQSRSGGNIIINGGLIYAEGDYGAGIGGGGYGDGSDEEEKIVINGGTIFATGKNNGAGIGGGISGIGGNIVIYDGEIHAEGDNGGAGIGSGYGSISSVDKDKFNCIKIFGGEIHAKGSTIINQGSAGIGGGHKGAGGVIEIYGGTIYAAGGDGTSPGDAIGDGGGYSGAPNNIVVLPTQSCPIIYAESGSEQVPMFSGSTENWQGIVFCNYKGQVYGNVTLTSDLTIVEEQSLLIPEGSALMVPDGVTLMNKGAITGNGTLKGKVAGNPPESTIDDGMAEVTIAAEPAQSGTVVGEGRYEEGSVVTLNATPAEGYHFVGWKAGENAIENTGAAYTFTLENDCQIMAIFEQHVPGAWQQDAAHHWKSCTKCHAPIERAAHDWAEGVCTTCGYACSHSGGQATCEQRAQCVTCGEAYGALSDHDYRYCERVAPTYDAAGLAAHYECSVCDRLFDEDKIEITREALTLPTLTPPVIVPSDPEPESEPETEAQETPAEELPPIEPMLPFGDVDEGAWYYDAVADVYAHGWMTGTSADCFAPDQTMTRAMVTAVLHRMAGSPAAMDTNFSDVSSGDWYETAVAWAEEEGVVNGFDDGRFQPNAAVTREQLAAMLQNYSAYQGVNVDARYDLSGYEDADAVSDWAEEAVSWACAEGVLAGMTETTLVPQGIATRAQMAALLLRLA